MTAIRQFLGLFETPTRHALAAAMVLSALVSLADFGALALLYPIFGELIGGASGSTPSFLPGSIVASPMVLVSVAIALMAARSIGAFAIRYWWGLQAAHAEVRLANRMLETYAYAPYSFHLRSNSTELMTRSVANVNMASSAGLTGMVGVAADGSSALAMTAALWLADPIAAGVITASLLVVGVALTLLSSRFIKHQSTLLSSRITRVYTEAANLLRGIRELTVSNGRDHAVRSVEDARRRMTRTQRNILILAEVPRLALDLVMYVGMLAALAWALASSQRDQVLPLVALYVVAGMRIIPGVARVLGTASQVRSAMEVGLLLRDEIDSVPRDRPSSNRTPYPSGDLVMTDVTYGYEDRLPPVLQEVSLEVPFGSMVGLIGPSGGGKTTLLSIMLGLLEPQEGTLVFGEQAVRCGDARWFATIAYVPQDVYMIDGTVVENVALGDTSPDREKAKRALEDAHLWPLVVALPEGMDTPVNEGGSRLSVGQRQRLGIARALYRNAKLILLDEPTAALDVATEAQVVETLVGLKTKVTTVVVAHRLSTLAEADKVYALEHGLLKVADAHL
jgi:ABC-type multidrug transport system fused ATPase/permease subunit